MRITIFLLTVVLLLPLEAQEKESVDQEMVGILSATFLYQSYLNIGFLADLHVAGQYDADKAQAHCETLLSVISGTRDELQAYRNHQLTETDQRYVAELVKVVDILLQECVALNEYIQTGDPAPATRFNELNAQAQEAISLLLGLEEIE